MNDTELLQFADDYLANNAAETGSDELIRQLAFALRLASRQEVSVEELALELMNARRRMIGLEELSAERVKKIGLWPLKEETMCAARALLAEYSITKRTTEG